MNEEASSSPRTFRIDADVMRGLEEEAKKQGATVNGLTCRILRKYIKIGTKLEQFGIIGLPKNDLIELINAVDENTLIRLASSMGSSIAKEIVLQLYGDLTVPTFKLFLSMFICGYANWASYFEDEQDGILEIRIGHSLGERWSAFLRNYIEAACVAITSQQPEFRYVSSYSIIFHIVANK
ncbi:MAG: hypothetical protein LUP94_03170 [Candidatus Methanomethylicus sp.]|nr:hypothetical protein [Candidatus Methanomethylicus sp.]